MGTYPLTHRLVRSTLCLHRHWLVVQAGLPTGMVVPLSGKILAVVQVVRR